MPYERARDFGTNLGTNQRVDTSEAVHLATKVSVRAQFQSSSPCRSRPEPSKGPVVPQLNTKAAMGTQFEPEAERTNPSGLTLSETAPMGTPFEPETELTDSSGLTLREPTKLVTETLESTERGSNLSNEISEGEVCVVESGEQQGHDRCKAEDTARACVTMLWSHDLQGVDITNDTPNPTTSDPFKRMTKRNTSASTLSTLANSSCSSLLEIPFGLDDASPQSMQKRGEEEVTLTSLRDHRTKRNWELRGKDAAIHRAFDKLDLDGNDTLDRFEISKVMEEATKKLKLDLEVGGIGGAVDALLDDANPAGPEAPCITRTQFVNLFRRHPDMLHAFDDESTMASIPEATLMAEGKDEDTQELLDEDEENHQVREFARTQWRNKRVALLWLCIYAAANIAAFAHTAFRYAHNEEAQAVFGSCITVARASAKCLNLNAFLILLPICRHLVTRMRAFGKLRLWFPFDATLEYHMIVGVVMAAFTVAHVGAHMCDFTRFAEADEQDIFALVGTKLGETIPESKAGRWMLLLKQPAGITGVIMLLCMGVAYATIRARRKNFNTFWITHHLFLVMLICLCFHGVGGLLEPFQSVYWIAGPLLLYLLPKLFRQTKYAQCQVLDIAVKGGNVVGLKLAKPASWNKHVKAGMYAFINVPKVSSIEWHPFTLTSAPHEDFIEFHFAQVGDWTKSVHSLLKGAVMHDGTAASRDDGGYDIPSMRDLVVKVEGPIGASSQGFSHYPILVLIGAGIGVTPMISVLKQLLKEPGKMKRTYLYWTVRDRASFEWFNTLMDDIYENSDEQRDRLQIRHFLTSVKDDVRDVGTVLLHHATRAKHKQTDFDFLLGRRTRHQVDIGRPNWGDELSSVRSDSKELGCRKCGVFLCGPQRMAQEVAQVSFNLSVEDPDFHFQFTKETF
jgi:predicted ferric reductase